MRLPNIIVYLLLISSTSLFGQQSPNYTMDLLNLYKVNKAFAGISDQLTVYSHYRTQWAGIERQPRQFNINANMPFYKLHGGIGIELESFRSGPEVHSSVKMSYNYIHQLKNGVLSGGLSFGASQLNINSDYIVTPEGNYQSGIDHQDLILDNSISSTLYPNYELSLFYSNANFDTGISFQNFVKQKTTLDNTINYDLSRYTSFLFVYFLELTNKIIYQPGLHVQSNLKETQIKLLNTIKYGNIFGGIGIRGYSNKSIESISLFSGIKFNRNYTIGYSYDVLLNELRNTSEGTHEILFRYDLNREINTGLPPKTMYNPRNL